MSIQTSYPGVYIEELPSGQHTIAPVATSITAFLGRAPVGPTDEPKTITNFGDYQRFYGGLSHDYPLSFAVRDFFANGGSQAVIGRLFEPNDPADSGVAVLPFPASPPMLPDGWLLQKKVSKGEATLQVYGPPDSEGEPVPGMQLFIGGDKLTPYTVTSYSPQKSASEPATIDIIPAFTGSGCSICCPLTFQQSPSPSGWRVSTGSANSLTLTGGDGLPELGDRVQFVGPTGETQTETIQSVGKITGADATALSVPLTLTAKMKVVPYGGQSVQILPPLQSTPPSGWQVAGPLTQKDKAGTVPVANGVGTPLVNSIFMFASDPSAAFRVTHFTPAQSGKKPSPANLEFELVGDGQMPSSLRFCDLLEFEDTAPADYTISAGPKSVGGTTMTVDASKAQGALDVGYTFKIQGGAVPDPTVYTIRVIDQSKGTISFLPGARTQFSSSESVTFSPPLRLVAANPGRWGNGLSAQVDTKGITERTAKPYKSFGLAQEDLFNLTLTLRNAANKVVASERYLNVAVRTGGDSTGYPGALHKVLQSQSNLARQAGSAMVPPSNGAIATASGGDDGTYLQVATITGNENTHTGLYLLDHVQQIDMLCIPPDGRLLPSVPRTYWDIDPAVLQAAATYCTDRRAILIADPPTDWTDKVKNGDVSEIDPSSLQIEGVNSAGIEVERNVAVYFPRVYMEDATSKNQERLFPACGVIAGVMAGNDAAKGVWTTPAGTDAGLAGVTKLEVPVSETISGTLNPLGINCLRTFPVIGNVIWGGRTLRGADAFDDNYKYLSVRRLTLFIEDSLKQGTLWSVFEPNDEALWSSLRLSVESFLKELSIQGAFYDYKVSCDAKTTTATDIELGRVNLLVQIAPVDPAEFVVIEIQQVPPTA